MPNYRNYVRKTVLGRRQLHREVLPFSRSFNWYPVGGTYTASVQPGYFTFDLTKLRNLQSLPFATDGSSPEKEVTGR